MINYFIFGISYSLACVVQPGPFQAFLFSQSLTNGWRKTVPLVFAPLISDLPIIILVLLILTNVPHEALGILQCFGGMFLLYLAFDAFKAWRRFSQNASQDFSPQQNIFKAVMINFLNPNPFLGWSLVMGPLLIKGWSKDPANGIVLLIGFYSSMIIYSIGMIILFSAARNLGPRVSRIAVGISVMAFAIFEFTSCGRDYQNFCDSAEKLRQSYSHPAQISGMRLIEPVLELDCYRLGWKREQLLLKWPKTI